MHTTATIRTVKQAQAIAGTLSNPSKMPCKGTSTPAKKCITGSKLQSVPGSVCASCYAIKGLYQFPTPQRAMAKRFEGLTHPQWVDAMTLLITKQEKSGYFRWHDSGDLQSLAHFKNIVAVVNATPHIQHWLPTREYSIISEFVAQGGILPANLIVRLSGLKINVPGPVALARRLGVQTSTVVTDHAHVTCQAPKQEGKCLDCRACWNKSVPNVAYGKH